jgi:hypothetical protein
MFFTGHSRVEPREWRRLPSMLSFSFSWLVLGEARDQTNETQFCGLLWPREIYQAWIWHTRGLSLNRNYCPIVISAIHYVFFGSTSLCVDCSILSFFEWMQYQFFTSDELLDVDFTNSVVPCVVDLAQFHLILYVQTARTCGVSFVSVPSFTSLFINWIL